MNALVEQRVIEVLGLLELGYEDYCKHLYKKYVAAKEDLRRLIVKDVDRKDFHFIADVNTICEALIFFPDAEIITMLNKIGLRAPELKWFVPLKDLEMEFMIIESNGFAIDRVQTLLYIQLYISLQFLNAIFLKLGKAVNHDNTLWNPVVKPMYDAYNRAEYARKKGNVPKDEFTLAIGEMAVMFATVLEKPAKRKLVTDIFQGKTEQHFLVPVLDSIKSLQTLKSTNKKLEICFGLFELVCKDGILGEEDKLIKRTKSQILRKYLYKK